MNISQINRNNVVTLDFETYYGDKYSLVNKDLNTSEYVRDERFKVHMVGIKVGDQPTRVYLENEVAAALEAIDWTTHALLCQNTAFDGLILSHHYGIVPALYLDTLSMSRALHGPATRHNLDTIAKRYGFAGKVREKALSNTKNIRDLSEKPELVASLSEYCADDVNDTHGIFWKMYEGMSDDELELIDITIRAFCDPVLLVDIPRVEAELEKEIAGKVAALMISGVDKERLLSAEKFADELRKLGVTPPMKISKTTGQPAYAFASTDRGFIALEKHDDVRVRNLVKARLLVKSTIGETRAGRFLEAGRDGMKLPVMLHYCGAHTFRWSGGNKMNLQNLVRGGELRRSLLAPPGHVIVVADSAQIEARMNAWLSDELALLEGFRQYDAGTGPDVYKIMASEIFGVPIDKVTATQRFVGKVCLAEGSLIYSSRGWIPIETLTTEDKLWDGENWVCHKGLLANGTKETLNISGLYMTPDHLVLCETEWKEAQYLVRDENTLFRALATGAVSWSSLGLSKAHAAESPDSSYSATVTSKNTPSITATSAYSKAHDVRNAQEQRAQQNAIGNIPKLCLTTSTVLGYSTELVPLSPGVTTQRIAASNTMANAEFRSIQNGGQTEPRFSNMFKHLMGGITQLSKWIERTLTVTTNRGTSGSYPEHKTCSTEEKSQTSKKKSAVYDILSVGPNNRFLALTSEGPIVVHNCVLGLGYGMGTDRLKDTLETGAMGAPITLASFDEYEVAKWSYRNKYRNIVNMWDTAKRLLYKMTVAQGTQSAGEYKCLKFGKDWVRLPNGMFLRYPNLRTDQNGGLEFDVLAGPTRIYGGLFVENLVQALARVVIAEQMLSISRLGYRIVTMTHDEIVVICPEDQADKCLADMLKVMSTPPVWAPTLPLSADGGYDTCYSK